MPLLRERTLRKRWRYVGVYGADVMLCAARVEIGPLAQSFWAVWDREGRRRLARTRVRPGGHEVEMDGPFVRLDGGEVQAELVLGDGEPVEAVCASGEHGYAWTRKRPVPVEGWVQTPSRRYQVAGPGMDDESAGYHRRHTSWHWSAGFGATPDRHEVAWNLVQGINDPPRRSERAIWIDGHPVEPAPVSFDGLRGIRFEDGAELRFNAESERARRDNFLLVRTDYRHVFGSFTGSLPGLELEWALGVMETHNAVW
jgi:hypothetical protein